MKGTQHADAVAAIDKVIGLKHCRPETVHKAIGAVLSYVGARRLHALCDTSDKDLVAMLAKAEEAAYRLDVIPQRVENGAERRAAMTEATAALTYVKVMLDAETLDVAEELTEESKRLSA